MAAMGEFFAGATMGMLIGSLIGLSTVPVVGGVVSALTALIGAFLGLAGPNASKLPLTFQPARVIGFGLCCVIAIVAGIIIRTHHLLAPAAKDQVASLVAAGFDQPAAIELVAYQNFGIVPAGKTIQENRVTQAGTSGLFAFESESVSAVCKELSRSHDQAPSERLKAFPVGGAKFRAIGDRISHVPIGNQATMLDAVSLIFCG